MEKVPGSTATAALDDSALVTPTSAPDEMEKVAEAWEDEILLQGHEMLLHILSNYSGITRPHLKR